MSALLPPSAATLTPSAPFSVVPNVPASLGTCASLTLEGVKVDATGLSVSGSAVARDANGVVLDTRPVTSGMTKAATIASGLALLQAAAETAYGLKAGSTTLS